MLNTNISRSGVLALFEIEYNLSTTIPPVSSTALLTSIEKPSRPVTPEMQHTLLHHDACPPQLAATR